MKLGTFGFMNLFYMYGLKKQILLRDKENKLVSSCNVYFLYNLTFCNDE